MKRESGMQDDKVSLVEMGPRDGLQNEASALPLVQRLELIARLAESGLQRIEVGAFVSPKKVPQMADSAALFKALPRKGATRYGALVPNLQGLQAAQAVDLLRVVGHQFLERLEFGLYAWLGHFIGVEELLVAGEQEPAHAGFHVDGQLDRLVGVVDDPVGVGNPLDDRQQVGDHGDEYHRADHANPQGQADIAAQQLAKALLIGRGWLTHVKRPEQVDERKSVTDFRAIVPVFRQFNARSVAPCPCWPGIEPVFEPVLRQTFPVWPEPAMLTGWYV